MKVRNKMDSKLVTKARKEYPCKKCGGTGTRYEEKYLSERVCAECCGTGINWRKALTESSIKIEQLEGELELLQKKYDEALSILREDNKD